MFMKPSSLFLLIGVVFGIFATSMFFGSKDPTDAVFNAGLVIVSVACFVSAGLLTLLSRKREVKETIRRLKISAASAGSDWTPSNDGQHSGVRR